MKKLLIAATMTAALGSTAAFAGGIQIDPLGGGSIAGSTFIDQDSFPSGQGDALLVGAFLPGAFGGGPGGADPSLDAYLVIQHGGGVAFAGNSQLTAAEQLAYTVSWQMIMPVTVSQTVGTPTSAAQNLQIDIDNTRSNVFAMFVNPVQPDRNAGTGYGDLDRAADLPALDFASVDASVLSRWAASTTTGTRVLEGTVNLSSSGGLGTFTGTSFSSLGPNALTVGTFSSNGSVNLEVDFNTLLTAAGYVVNDPTSAALDMFLEPVGLTTPFTGGSGPADLVVGVDPYYGAGNGSFAGGLNDFTCGTTGGSATAACDFQARTSVAYEIVGDRVPEPASLAMLASGLLVAGWTAKRSRKNAG